MSSDALLPRLWALTARLPGALPPQDPAPTLPPGRHVAVTGGALFVRELAGPPGALPVVLLHPWSWTGDVAFAPLLAPLAARHRVISVDLRGHGRSVGVGAALALDELVDDVLAVLDALGVARALWCGHSLGGLVAMGAALRAPARVAGVVVAAAAACYTTTRRDRWFWRGLRAAGPLARRELGRSLPLRYFLDGVRAEPALLRRWCWLEAELASSSARAMWQVGQMVSRLDLRAALASRAPCPAAYVLLTRDAVCAPSLQRDTAARLGARVFALDDDHHVPVSAPARYAAALLAALADVAARAAPLTSG